MDIDELSRVKYQGYLYSTSVADVPVKGFSPWHCGVHNCIEILYCLSGEEEIVIDGKSHRITKGMMRVCPPQHISTEKVFIRTVEETKYIDIGFVTMDPFITENLIIDSRKSRKVEELTAKLLKIVQGKYENWFFDATSVFWLLVKEIRILINHTDHRVEYLDKKLFPAIEHIHENYSRCDFDFSELPELCSLKNNYFHKIFKQRYNVTPAKYVTNLRMQLATDYLLSGNRNISEIAELVGYDSVAYFSRVFKNHFGISPSKYSNEKLLAYSDYL